MLQIGNTIVSDDLLDVQFICHLSKCHGDSCIAGDAGAPVEEEEIAMLEDHIDEIKPYMSEQGLKVIEEDGVFDYDADGAFVTPLVNHAECAYVYLKDGIAWCAIEKAHNEGKINFLKPLSCHLYPVRITKHGSFDAVNYHKWNICKSALKMGRRAGMPLYKFLKDPLTRKYGEEWYAELERLATARADEKSG